MTAWNWRHRCFSRSQVATRVAMLCVLASPAMAASTESLAIQGNRRIDAETVRSYFHADANGRYDAAALDTGLKALVATGLFEDVKMARSDGRIVVRLSEAKVLDRVAFEGNKKVKDAELAGAVLSKPRAGLQRATVQGDVARILQAYHRVGRDDVRVVPEIIDRGNDRVDLVFTITEGKKTPVRAISFVGNNAYSAARLRDVIKTHQSNWLSFLGNNDVYDPDRVEADRDLIRRFYLKNGYADVQVVAALTEYDPDQKGFLVTFQIDEGQQYRVSAVQFQSTVAALDVDSLRTYSRLNVGALYNVEQLEKSVEEMQIEASRRGFSFAVVHPRGDRNMEAHTVAIVFQVDEGPRTYIERITIRGNTRTRDYVIRREFDISEGDAYNRALVDRAERRLKNLDFFKEVKIATEPGSSSDRVILVVSLEEKSTGDFSISGGYSTTDGALAEVSVSERNFLGRGLYAKAAVTYGQYTRGVSLSFVEPYLLDYRIALGLDVSYRQQLANSYTSYGTRTVGFSPRLGFQLREDLSLQLRYSLYRQEITLPSYLANCNNNSANGLLAFNPTPAYIQSALGGVDPTNSTTSGVYGYGCYGDGESSLAVRKELNDGAALTSALGYTLSYNTLDNTKNPTDGLLIDWKQDFAGVGGNVSYLKSAFDAKYFTPLVSDIVSIVHLQGGILNKIGNNQLRMLDHFQMGPNLVRGFAPNGIGPRDINPFGTQDALGGTKYWGASLELQMPFWFLPKETGLKGAVYADAGGLWGYQGPTSWAQTGEVNVAGCAPPSRNPNNAGTCLGLQFNDQNTVRTSVGVGLVWASPFGPLRFDYAIPLTKGQFDRTQEFRFGGGTSF